MKLSKLSESLEELNAVIESEDISKEHLDMMVHGIVSALAMMEADGMEFESAKDAMSHVMALLKAVRGGSGKGVLMQALRKFDRVGAERSAQVYKRELSKGV